VPCSPELAAHLQHHLDTYGTAPDGRLFPGPRGGGRLSNTVYGRAWAKARQAAFIPEVAAGSLAKRPYDLTRVLRPRVAAWAGHCVAVLLRVYAKCLDGGEQLARAKVSRP
jgi:hypothetical protein